MTNTNRGLIAAVFVGAAVLLLGRIALGDVPEESPARKAVENVQLLAQEPPAAETLQKTTRAFAEVDLGEDPLAGAEAERERQIEDFGEVVFEPAEQTSVANLDVGGTVGLEETTQAFAEVDVGEDPWVGAMEERQRQEATFGKVVYDPADYGSVASSSIYD